MMAGGEPCHERLFFLSKQDPEKGKKGLALLPKRVEVFPAEARMKRHPVKTPNSPPGTGRRGHRVSP
jgi:hypothetical protein